MASTRRALFLIFLAPQPSSAMLLAQDSVKSERSSLATVSSMIGFVAFGAFHSGGFFGCQEGFSDGCGPSIGCGA
jgi:hypothetical protein